MSKREREEDDGTIGPADAAAATEAKPEDASAGSPAKRKRGRPKKTATQGGEQSKDGNGSKSPSLSTREKRPRKAKDKATAEGGNGQGIASASTEGTTTMSVTGTGASTSTPTEGTPVKRGRGRPKKDPNAPPTPKKKKEPAPPLLNADGTPVKRGRGRPRKDPNAPPTPRKKKTESTPPPLNADGTPVKRGRGRPRKNPVAGEGEKAGAAKKQRTGGKEGEASTSGSSSGISGSRYLEKGWVYFFYRPKVELEEAHSLKEVQKLYMLLVPRITADDSLAHGSKQRLIVLTKKKLPEIHSHSRYWGFVEEVGERFEEIHHDLDKITYKTKTRGTRTIEAARPVGEGFYGILEHHGHTHLAYVLELPQELGKAQKAFNIVKEGSYIITIKNPSAPVKVDAPGLHLKEHANLPKELLDKFHGNRWMPANPPSVLDYEQVELVIIGASDDLKAELGEAGKELEKDEEKDVQGKKLSDNTLFEELHMSKKTHPPMALLKGKLQ